MKFFNNIKEISQKVSLVRMVSAPFFKEGRKKEYIKDWKNTLTRSPSHFFNDFNDLAGAGGGELAVRFSCWGGQLT
jgi:hypothetical protein